MESFFFATFLSVALFEAEFRYAKFSLGAYGSGKRLDLFSTDGAVLSVGSIKETINSRSDTSTPNHANPLSVAERLLLAKLDKCEPP